jgi:hypothetical protein
MIIPESKMRLIKEAIEKHYATLLIQLLGKKDLSRDTLAKLKKQGLNVRNIESLLARVYHHTYLNEHASGPKSLGEMETQQEFRDAPKSHASKFSVEQLNQNLLHLIDKQRAEMVSRIDGMLRDENHRFKFQFQAAPKGELDRLLKEKTLHQIKQRLTQCTEDGNRNWERVVHTEVSNAVGMGSADRILKDNEEKPAHDVFVYRIITPDEATCRWCKRFYMDSDGSPRVYRLSELLANGSNYGKPTRDWRPGIAATHPNERCSAIIELPPGWKVLVGGQQTFMGHKGWDSYIAEKLSSR